MNPSRRRITAAGLFGLAGASSWGALAQDKGDKVYRFSPVNQYGIELTARYWNPIIDHVSSRSGVKLELKIGRTSADTTAFVLANEVEFVFSNHLFSPDRDKLGWKVFGRRNTPPMFSQIVVLADSPLRTLEDLADQPVGFPGAEAVVSYKFPYAQLLRRRVGVQVVFAGNMDGAFAQLRSGRVKAVGANSQLTDGWSQRENQAVRVLWQSEPLNDLALMAAKSVRAPTLEAVKRAFLGMLQDPVGKSVLASAGEAVKLPAQAGFIAADGSEYAAYRQFYATAPAELR